MQKNLKILFIGLNYHNYTGAIIDEIRRIGCDIKYIDIQPRSFLFKVLKTISNSIYAIYLNIHHRRAILRSALQQYDQVIFLQVHQMSFENLILLRGLQKGAKFTLYNWDSLSSHDYLSRAHFFDRVLTFDQIDASQHNFSYLPLFCIRSIQALRRERNKARSVYMVGNIVNINRYFAVRNFSNYCKLHNIHFKTYLVVSPVVYFRMLTQGIWPIGVHFKSIPDSVFTRMIEEAVAVYDFANHQQAGYTMRIIENLCAGKKIITNNSNVLGDYFFSPDRVLCFNGFDFSNVSDFLDVELKEPNLQFEELHIQSFVQQLLASTTAIKQIDALEASL